LIPDIRQNRRTKKWSLAELIGRAAWEMLSTPLFAWTPRQAWEWRCIVLRAFGAHIHRGVHIHPSVKIAVPWTLYIGENSAIGDAAIVYSLGPIRIGKHVTISQYAHLCAGTHDFRKRDMPLVRASIEVGDGAWICADAFIGPHVRIGAMSIVGARAVVVRDVPEKTIVAGNPATSIGQRPDCQE